MPKLGGMKKVVTEQMRLNLRIPSKLGGFAKAYAKSMNTTLTRLIIEHLNELKCQWERDHGIEQI